MAYNWTCPFCGRDQTATNDKMASVFEKFTINDSTLGDFGVYGFAVGCSNEICKRVMVTLAIAEAQLHAGYYRRNWKGQTYFQQRVIPSSAAKPQPNCVPEPIQADYNEACAIGELSPKASATLIRRCLQGMIRDFCGIARPTLKQEIDHLRAETNAQRAPAGVTIETVDAIDSVREIGNIGAHMEKDINLIIDVDPDEAKLLIDLVEMLFIEWYVARENRTKSLAAIKKLAEDKKAAKSAALPAPETT